MLNWKVQLAFGSAILALVVVGAISYRGMVMSTESDRWVRHTHEVLENLQDSLAALEGVESGYRAFVITGNEEDLSHYRESVLRSQQEEITIRTLTVDNPEQQREMRVLQSLADQKIQYAETVIGLRRTHGLEAAEDSVRAKDGQQTMDEYRSAIHKMQEEELRLLAIRDADAKWRLSQAKTVLMLGTALGLFIAVAAGWSVQRDSSGRRIAEESLRESEVKFRAILESAPDAMVVADAQGRVALVNAETEQLFGYRRDELIGQPVEILVPDRFRQKYPQYRQGYTEHPRTWSTDEGLDLQGVRKDATEFPVEIRWSQVESIEGILVTAAIRDITERRRTEEVKRVNIDLERRVLERTSELAAANKELEAFAYSVAHDLRAPLRHIDGFSNLLIERLGDSLDEGAQHYLETIQGSARDMGLMVDDLLNLSRVARQEMNTQVTGLNSLVEEVLKDLKPEIKDREIEWKIGSLPFVECDHILVKQVFVNLLSNAIKFTRTRDRAIIEVGQSNVEGESLIFVRDNGVGFSMKYSDKLFGVFQRLHRQEDFEGTGVGLATVQRIVQKHGGRVWARADLNTGATFYFTLGTQVPVTGLIEEVQCEHR